MDDIKKAKLKAYKHEYYLKNKERINARNKKWALENKEREAANHRKWYEVNKDSHNARRNKWKLENKAREAANLANYRAKKFRATVYMSLEMKRKVAEVYTIAQEASITTGYDWDVDHIVPLSKGGLHTLSNLQVVPATWNVKKSNNNCDRYWD